MIVGTAGHIDHGKTSLVKALTGIDADRLKEEKARGITIDLGYAYTPLPNGDMLGFVDVPGHEKLVHNMVAGATGIDFVLLAIAADDGPMPQTREHLAILDLLGLDRAAVALTKIDRVSPRRREVVLDEITALLHGTALQGSPVFPVAAPSGEGIAPLRAFLDETASAMPPRLSGGHFRLAVDRVFTLNGSGTVVTGSVFSGEVRPGERLQVSPQGIEVRVRGIHAQNRPAGAGRAGQRCALNLAANGFEKKDIRRGDWLVAPAVHAPAQRLDARLRLLAGEARNLEHWTPVHFHLGAVDVTARVALLEGQSLAPGGSALAQIITARPVCALHGDRFVLRDQSATRTLGGGVVLDAFAPTRHGRKPERLAALAAMETRSVPAALGAALEQVGEGVDLERFAINRNLRADELGALRETVPMEAVATPAGTWTFSLHRWRGLKSRALGQLALLHRQEPDSLGPDRERLRRIGFPRLEKAVFAQLVAQLLTEGAMAQSGPWLHLPDHRVSLAASEERQWSGIAPLLAEDPFQPPRVRDIAKIRGMEEDKVRRLLRRVVCTGEVYLVAHDHYFTRAAVRRLAAIVAELASESEGARASEFRDRIGSGRKLAIQILEFFDRIGYTRRTGDAHRLRQEYSALWL